MAITVEDVRVFLNDYPEINKLTGESLFSPARIEAAINNAIDEWNITPPIVEYVTCETFPFKSALILGVVGWLYQGEATVQERNHLTYSSGGLSVDDDNHADKYLQFANYFRGLYKQHMAVQKGIENIDDFWSTTSGVMR